MHSKRILFFAFLSIFITSRFCYADDAETLKILGEMQARIEALEEKVAQQEAYIKSQESTVQAQERKIDEYESRFSQFDEKLHRETGLQEKIAKGLEIGAGATMIVQATNNTNATQEKKRGRCDASFSEDITIQKDFEGVSGKAFLHLEAGQGDGLIDELSLYSNVNKDAINEEHVSVAEILYEQGLFENKAILTFGKLDPSAYFDNNKVANDETTQFISNIFRNNPTIEFPDNTVAVRAAVLPIDWLELNYGVFDGNSDWDNIGDNLFHAGEVTFKANFAGLEGNYRVYGWYSKARHIEWLDAEKQKEALYGLGLSFDQKLCGEMTAFARYGWVDPRRYNPDLTASGELNYSLEHSWSTGLEIQGKPWHRDNDVLALAVGQVIPSDDYKKAFEPELNAKVEGHLEAYYNIHINDHLAVSPDIQYIWNPFGKDIAEDTNGIFVGGVRAQVDF